MENNPMIKFDGHEYHTAAHLLFSLLHNHVTGEYFTEDISLEEIYVRSQEYEIMVPINDLMDLAYEALYQSCLQQPSKRKALEADVTAGAADDLMLMVYKDLPEGENETSE